MIFASHSWVLIDDCNSSSRKVQPCSGNHTLQWLPEKQQSELRCSAKPNSECRVAQKDIVEQRQSRANKRREALRRKAQKEKDELHLITTSQELKQGY